MSLHVRVAFWLLVVGLLALAGVKVWQQFTEEATALRSSDARALKGRLTVGVDNWIGYFPLCSHEMRTRMRHSGYLLVCEDDHADYGARLKRLAAGELQFAAATVDSYLQNGEPVNYPGTIVAVLDESKGGDAVVAWQEQVASLEALKRAQGVKVAFTPNSPSHHLLRSLAVHFDVPLLKGAGWQLAADGSSDALKRFLRKESAVAVLWEPDVSRALKQPGVVKLIGTEHTRRLIVDVLLAQREFSLRDPEAVSALLGNYFLTLKHYRDRPEQLVADAVNETQLGVDEVRTLLKGVAWAGLGDNAAAWFGVAQGGGRGEEALVQAIESALSVLRESGALARNPLPGEDPYRLQNSTFIAALDRQGAEPVPAAAATLERPFTALTDPEWAQLREVGSLKVLPILFSSGTAQLTLEGKAELDKGVENLRHYPNFRVVVKGHTGLDGDPDENRRLSQARAEAVARYLEVTYGIAPERLHPLGLGAGAPLPRLPDESARAYAYRLPRVELFLVTEAL